MFIIIDLQNIIFILMIPYYQNYYNTLPYFNMSQNFYDQSWFYPIHYQSPNTSDLPLASEIQGSGLCDKNDVSNVISSYNSAQNGFIQENNEIQIKVQKESVISATFEVNEGVSKSSQDKGKADSQKDGRNSNSNLLRMFFRRMEQIIDNEPELIKRVIKKNKMRIKPAKFAEWYEYNQVQHRNYIRLPSARKLFLTRKFNKEATKIMRILLKDFLQKEAHTAYLTSKKIKRESMPYNLLSFRNIFSDLVKSIAEQ